jgi:hypothetical protein
MAGSTPDSPAAEPAGRALPGEGGAQDEQARVVLSLVGVLSGDDGGERQLDHGAMLGRGDRLERRVNLVQGFPGMAFLPLGPERQPHGREGIVPAGFDDQPSGSEAAKVAIQGPAPQRTDEGRDGVRLTGEECEDGPVGTTQRPHETSSRGRTDHPGVAVSLGIPRSENMSLG